MGKLSALPSNTSPVIADLLVMIQQSGPTDQKVTIQNLMNLIFSGQITSYSTGGTFFYANLGGIKLFWGQASSISITTSGIATGAITFPTSFFTTIQSAQVTGVPGTDARAIAQVNTVNATTLNLYAWNTGGVTSACAPYIFVIGT